LETVGRLKDCLKQLVGLFLRNGQKIDESVIPYVAGRPVACFAAVMIAVLCSCYLAHALAGLLSMVDYNLQ
jgi:hypothetical protein